MSEKHNEVFSVCKVVASATSRVVQTTETEVEVFCQV